MQHIVYGGGHADETPYTLIGWVMQVVNFDDKKINNKNSLVEADDGLIRIGDGLVDIEDLIGIMIYVISNHGDKVGVEHQVRVIIDVIANNDEKVNTLCMHKS